MFVFWRRRSSVRGVLAELKRRLVVFVAWGVFFWVPVFWGAGAVAGALADDGVNSVDKSNVGHSGFFGVKASETQGLQPYTKGYVRDNPPPLRIPEAAKATVLIYNHGTDDSFNPEDCRPRYKYPPRSVLMLENQPHTYVYFLCSAVTDKDAPGTYTFRRSAEMITVAQKMVAVGVDPRNIFLLGQSAGGWAALLAMDVANRPFNAVIAFAPACCGKREGVEENDTRNRRTLDFWRGKVRPDQLQRMARSRVMRALIFAYDDDVYNLPEDWLFLPRAFADKPGSTVKLVSYRCGTGHVTAREDCRQTETTNIMKDFIAARKADF